jgi:hypothetical protein
MTEAGINASQRRISRGCRDRSGEVASHEVDGPVRPISKGGRDGHANCGAVCPRMAVSGGDIERSR